MTRSVLVVLSDPTEGAEDEYNAWYTTEHLPEVLDIPGFVSAQRYRVADGAEIPNRPAPATWPSTKSTGTRRPRSTPSRSCRGATAR
jgi:hypothetical protein